MNSAVRVLIVLVAVAALWVVSAGKVQKPPAPPVEAPPVESAAVAVEKGAKWLASVQGADGGWGQDGGRAAHTRTGEQLESQGNDVANTAVAALALLRAGKQYRPNVERALAFILQRVEASPADGLSITEVKGTQIQRKLGPYIDTFLTSMLLAQVDGTLGSGAENARIRRSLEKCVAKIEKNQKSDGSWNSAGGWAPVLGTSLASRSLYEAQQKGVSVQGETLARAEGYTVKALEMSAPPPGVGGGSIGGVGSGRGATTESAGVDLYQSAQALEQLSRTEKDRVKNAREIAAIGRKLGDAKFVAGYGSIGGEEFFSYLNISDSLKRTGGEEWKKWRSQIMEKILKLQNSDGTWAGHHCITGRVAVTGAALLNLTVDHAN